MIDVQELLDRLEAAEKARDDVAQQLVQAEIGKRKLDAECDALRARIEAMERQEPVVWMLNCPTLGGDTGWILSWTQSGAGLCNRLQGEENEKKLYALPGAHAQPTPSVPDDIIEQAVTRFLSWKLPKDFHPDGGMVFIPTKGRGYDSPHWPSGTNLFNAEQAREMLRYVLAAAPEAKP